MTKAKVTKKTDNYKISVDTYEEQANGVLKCYCFTPGNDSEESYIERTVSMQHLQDFVCDKSGRVSCTYYNDTQETEDITFERWYDDNRHTPLMNEVLSDLINKLDKRKKSYVISKMASAADRVISNLDKIILHLNPQIA